MTTKPKLIKKLDAIFSKWVRVRDSENWLITCVSCRKKIERKKAHNCHFLSRSNYNYRRDPRNTNAGCSGCNTYRPEYHLREYTIWMIDTYGRELVDEMRTNKRLAKITVSRLQEQIEYYTKELKTLALQKNIKI